MKNYRKAGKKIAAAVVCVLVSGFTVQNSVNTGFTLETFADNQNLDEEFEAYLNEQGFPESYRPQLRALHELHPSWVFTAFQTGLDWDTVIENEMVFKRNLVIDQAKYPSGYKDTSLVGSYDWDNDKWVIISDPYWVQASQEAVEYFMDPRNWFTEEYMFQFELETFNKDVQNLEGVEKILAGTFMSNTLVEGCEEKEHDYISSEKYTVTSEYISGIKPGTKVGELLSALSVTEGQLCVLDSKGNVKDGSVNIGTGDYVCVITHETAGDVSVDEGQSEQAAGQENLTKELGRCQVVILGDIDGNGKIDAVDRAFLKAYVYGTLSLSDIQLKAADANQDFSITSLDRAYLKASVYGTLNIPQVLKSNAITYAQLFMKIAEECNVSPYLLASRVRQEQGVNGTSDLISGTYPGFEGYYNYFNISAYGTTRQEIIENGLNEAKANGWTSRYLAIEGGAKKLCEGHIWKGQDTLYLQKFDVEGEYYGLYWHQYMQNLLVATNEGRNVYLAYRDMGALDEDFVFKIPVYENMPDEACAEPITDGNPNYKLKSITIKNYSIDFNKDVYDYYINVPRAVKSIEVSAEAIAATTTVTGTGTITLKSTTPLITITTKAENGATAEYRIHLNRT